MLKYEQAWTLVGFEVGEGQRMVRKILHFDLDAFYCAVEEQRHGELKGAPFAVGGRPESRGVVASCSYAARRFGIRSAMGMAQAVRLCPQPAHFAAGYAGVRSDVRAGDGDSAQDYAAG